MPMRLTVGTHYAGQTSWWLNGHNHSVVAWAGRTFDSMTDATQAANDFKTRSATAEFEVAMYWTGETRRTLWSRIFDAVNVMGAVRHAGSISWIMSIVYERVYRESE
jgi:hypothetical protein